jgi:hypothetical protein
MGHMIIIIIYYHYLDIIILLIYFLTIGNFSLLKHSSILDKHDNNNTNIIIDDEFFKYDEEMAYLLTQQQEHRDKEVVDSYGNTPSLICRKSLYAILSLIYIRHNMIANIALSGLMDLLQHSDFFVHDLIQLPISSITMIDVTIEVICDRIEITIDSERESILRFLNIIIKYAGSTLSLLSLQRIYRSLSFLCFHYAYMMNYSSLDDYSNMLNNTTYNDNDNDYYDNDGKTNSCISNNDNDANNSNKDRIRININKSSGKGLTAFKLLSQLMTDIFLKAEKDEIADKLPSYCHNNRMYKDDYNHGDGMYELSIEDIGISIDALTINPTSNTSSSATLSTYTSSSSSEVATLSSSVGLTINTTNITANNNNNNNNSNNNTYMNNNDNNNTKIYTKNKVTEFMITSMVNEFISEVLEAVELFHLSEVAYLTVSKQSYSTVNQSFWKEVTALSNTFFSDHSYRCIFTLLSAICKQSWFAIRTNQSENNNKSNNNNTDCFREEPIKRDVSYKLVVLSSLEQFCNLSGENIRMSKILDYQIRRIVIPCLLYNLNYCFLHSTIFSKILRIITILWTKWRRHIRIEFAIICEQFIFKVMQSSIIQVRKQVL